MSGSSFVEICARHLHTPVVPPSEVTVKPIPKGLEALILACLEKDPKRRPDNAEALIASLDALPDVPAWTSADARAWWLDHRNTVRKDDPKPTTLGSRTVAVDLRDRTVNVAAATAPALE